MVNQDNLGEKALLLAKAESFLEQGLLKESEDYARNCLEKFPHDTEARIILCQTWTRMGKLDKVKKMLEEVDAAIFGMSVIYAKMGDLCQRSGLNQEAIAFYQKFLGLQPHSPLTQEVTEKLHSLAPASAMILPREEEVPQHSLPIMRTVTMAELYIKQGHADLAAELLQEIVKKNPTNQRALAMLSEISGGKTAAEKSALPEIGQRPHAVIMELNRWLHNIHRIRSYAA